MSSAESDNDVDEDSGEDELELLAYQQSIRPKRDPIMNTAALLEKLNELKDSVKSDAWEDQMALWTKDVVTVENAEDDLKREVVFYEHALAGVVAGQKKLDDLGVPHRRPDDYFAECVKSDTHMLKIKRRLVEDKKEMEASAERRKQRDMAKYGKQVQVAKIQERQREKKQNIEKLSKWRKQVSRGERDDEFPIELEDNPEGKKGKGGFDKKRKEGPGGGKGTPNAKRRRKDEQFGFGGKKKHMKDNTADSTADLSDFSLKKNRAAPPGFKNKGKFKGKPQGGPQNRGGPQQTKKKARNMNRPGKSRRQQIRSKGGRK